MLDKVPSGVLECMECDETQQIQRPVSRDLFDAPPTPNRFSKSIPPLYYLVLRIITQSFLLQNLTFVKPPLNFHGPLYFLNFASMSAT